MYSLRQVRHLYQADESETNAAQDPETELPWA